MIAQIQEGLEITIDENTQYHTSATLTMDKTRSLDWNHWSEGNIYVTPGLTMIII